MTTFWGTAVTDPIFDLAEGLVWDERSRLVRWVDINEGRVLTARLRGDRLADTDELKLNQTVGSLALAEDGGLLIAAARGLAVASPDGEISLGPDIVAPQADVRLNDGSADPFGAFVVGTLSLGDEKGDGELIRVRPNGHAETIRRGVWRSNGVAFSLDGTVIYHVDTIARSISSHSYGPGPFDHTEPWSVVVDDLPRFPDGMTVDAAGALWVAQWGGSRVQRYSPSGEQLEAVFVDAVQVTCPGFIGPDFAMLGITTAREGLDSPADQAGALFVADVGVSGVAAYRWAGSTAFPYWQTSENREDTL